LGPNDLWCTDYKGEFQLGDKRYCYPLTVTDHASRYLLLCEALESNRQELAFRAFERLFNERGLPRAIRSDNGVPFASPHGLFQLSRLSVWWLRLDAVVNFLDTDRLAGQASTEIDLLAIQTQAAAVGDDGGLVVERVTQFSDAPVRAAGRRIDLSRTFHIERFVWPLIVELL
jgi:hypothetical protein